MRKTDNIDKQIENVLRLYPYMLVFNKSYSNVKKSLGTEVEEKFEMYTIIINMVEQLMKILNKDERRFIELRYFENWSIIKIAIELNYSEQMIFQIRKKVLAKLVISFLPIIENKYIRIAK